MISWTRFGVASVMLSSTGCAAASYEAPRPALAPVMPAPAPAPPPAVVEALTAPTTGSAVPPAASLADARLALISSSRELAAAGGNCKNACRALGSMDRAAGRLCTLAVSPGDQRACGDAKSSVVAARSEVRASCTSCAAGVVVDPDAPCPSP